MSARSVFLPSLATFFLAIDWSTTGQTALVKARKAASSSAAPVDEKLAAFGH